MNTNRFNENVAGVDRDLTVSCFSLNSRCNLELYCFLFNQIDSLRKRKAKMINESNLTSNSSPLIEWFPGLQLFACIFYTLVILVGITGNVLVIIIVMKFQDMKNATNLLLTNLSVADLFFLLFCSADGFQHLYAKDKHLLGNFLCKMNRDFFS